MSPSAPDPVHSPAAAEPPRRNFFVSFLAGAIGVFVGAVPFIYGTLFFLDPLIRKKKAHASEGDGFIPVAGDDAIPADGTPQLFTVYQDAVDAWNRFPGQPVGTVYVVRDQAGELHAFNTLCPHLGCTVDYRPSQKDFYCPCHLSSFHLDGTKANPIPPRGMDELEVKVVDGQVQVKFQCFRAATPEKIPVT